MTLCVLLFDVFFGPVDMVRQVLTACYTRTTGTIVRSEVVLRGHDEEGSPRYDFRLLYRYEVDGGLYEGSTVSHSPSLGFSSASSLKERFAEGATVPVFYHPESPAQAVLEKGFQRADLFLLLFLTPFHLLLIFCWNQDARASRQRRSVSSFRASGRTHVSLAVTNTLGAASYGMFLASFVAVLALFWSGFESSWSSFGVGWGVVGLTGVAVALWYRAKLGAGEFDLILDERRERLSVPAMFDRSERLELALNRIQSVTVEEYITKDSEGDPVSSWRPTLTFTPALGESESVPLADYKDKRRAEVLARWLRRRLRLDHEEKSVLAPQAA
jgi:hypothetical protein